MSAPERAPTPSEVVLGAASGPSRRGALVACAIALGLHLGAGAVTVAWASTPEQPRKRTSKPLVVFQHVVDLAPEPPPPAPAPETPPPPPPPAPKAKPRPAPKAQPQASTPPPETPPAPAPPPEQQGEPPPAAQAGQVVAAAPGGQAAAFNVATGSGSGYAGGTTTASGTGTKANHTGQIGQGNGLGRAPQVRTRNWPCGWPVDAEDLDADEVFVTVRATIRPDGSVADVQVESDPGHGFGRLAASCLRSKIRFDPALDDQGQPIAGTTPPMRVRFIRE